MKVKSVLEKRILTANEVAWPESLRGRYSPDSPCTVHCAQCGGADWSLLSCSRHAPELATELGVLTDECKSLSERDQS